MAFAAESPPTQGASKPQGSSERVLPWQITKDQIICASLSHTHYYWYEVVIACMLKIPAGTAPIATLLLPYYFISFDCCCCHSFLLLCFYFAAVCRILRYPYCPCLVFLSALHSAAYRTAPIATLVSFFFFFLFFPFCLFGRCRFFQVFFVPFPLSFCMESTTYVLSFRMVFFYLVTTGWISYISLLCENSIISINQGLCLFLA